MSDTERCPKNAENTRTTRIRAYPGRVTTNTTGSTGSLRPLISPSPELSHAESGLAGIGAPHTAWHSNPSSAATAPNSGSPGQGQTTLPSPAFLRGRTTSALTLSTLLETYAEFGKEEASRESLDEEEAHKNPYCAIDVTDSTATESHAVTRVPATPTKTSQSTLRALQTPLSEPLLSTLPEQRSIVPAYPVLMRARTSISNVRAGSVAVSGGRATQAKHNNDHNLSSSRGPQSRSKISDSRGRAGKADGPTGVGKADLLDKNGTILTTIQPTSYFED